MATWEIDLADGSTVEVEADNLAQAQAEQQRRNEQLARPRIVDQDLQVDTGMQEFQNVLSGLPSNALAGLAEMGSAAGRSMAQGLDFLGPGTANAALRLAGSETQLPTFEAGYEQLPRSQGGFMAPGTPRDVVRGFGGAAPATLGTLPVAGRNIASPMGATMEFLGLGAAKPQAAVAPLSFGQDLLTQPTPATAAIGNKAPGDLLPRPQTRGMQEAGRLAAEGSESARRAGVDFDPYTGRAIANVAARSSETQGLEPGFVSMVQAATRETKDKLLNMLDVVERGREFMRAKSDVRPFDVAGASMGERVDVLKRINDDAARRIDDVAETLRGQTIDPTPATNQFLNDLRRLNVDVDDVGEIGLDFSRSDLALSKGPRRQIQELVNWMKGNPAPDAYDVHQLKRLIDEAVTYGKSKRGLSGKAETALKKLRRNIDSMLDEQFPEYNRVNTEYSETVGALDELQGLAGRKNDIFEGTADRVIGTLLRRIESNAASGPQMLRSLERIDRLANKYRTGQNIVPYRGVLDDAPVPTSFNDDIRTQVLFADQLNSIFGTPAGTSFQGEIGKVVEKAAEDTAAGQGGLYGALSGLGRAGYRGLRGVNEENALKALRELLEQQ